jgi:DNA-binding IclR family transcriptional regulator
MIQVIHRAFDIIELCSKNRDRELTLSEIADKLELNHGTCANIIKTMITRNYIEQLGYKKGYRLGPMISQLAGSASLKQELIQAAKSPMEQLVNELNETCLIGIMRKSDNKRVVLHQVHCNQDIVVRTAIEKEIYNTTTGRVILAYMAEKEMEKVIQKHGLPSFTLWHEADTREKLDQELARIRREGFAFQRTPTHIVGLAVPVFRAGVVIAGLSIYMPEMRYAESMKELAVSRLIEAGKQIDERLNANILDV